jgi:hypothetical protein
VTQRYFSVFSDGRQGRNQALARHSGTMVDSHILPLQVANISNGLLVAPMSRLRNPEILWD